MLALVAGSLTILSCSESKENEVIDNNPNVKTFLVGSPTSSTRAIVRDGQINEQGPYVDWETTDKIYVWGKDNTTGYTYNFTKHGNYKNYAAFEGTAFSATKYYLMYPNLGDDATVTAPSYDGNGIITATIPMCQKATANSFDPRAAVCTGATEGQYDTSVSIAHACAFLKITTTLPCYKVVVRPVGGNGEQNWSMSGEVNIETSSSGSKIVGFPSGAAEVRLTKNGSISDTDPFPAGTYLMAIVSSTKFPGYDVYVDYGLGEGEETPHNPHKIMNPVGGKQFNAGFIYNLGIADANIAYN